MARAEGKVTVPDGQTLRVLFLKADGMTDIDVKALRVNCPDDGITIYVIADGVLEDTTTEPIGGDNAMEALDPPIECDSTFEVRVKNESGADFDAVAACQYSVTHVNRAPVPSRIKVKPNMRLRRRFIRRT